MKKFLKKKGTMIGSIVAAAVVFILLLAFCIRPVSVGYSYKMTSESEHLGKYTVTYHFDSFSKVTVKSEYEKEDYATSGEEQCWYFVKDGVLMVGPSVKSTDKDAWNDMKEKAIEKWDSEKMKKEGTRIDAFKVYSLDADGEIEEDKAINGGAIATVIVLAVVDAVLVAGAVASVILRKKKA